MKAEPKVALIFLETARKGHKIEAKRKRVPEPVA